MCEIWKKIEGYENYWVSNLGRIKSSDRWIKKKKRFGYYDYPQKGKVLIPRKTKNGYLLIGLSNNGKSQKFYVHRLVAKAFIPNPDNLPEINHKNEDKTDNRVESLEYCSHNYNYNYGTRIERITEKRSKPIYQFDKEGNFIKEWASASEVQRQMGYKQGNISTCCLGKTKQSYGYIWKFKEKRAA